MTFPDDELPTKPTRVSPLVAAESRRALAERVLEAWGRSPQYRLGQLLVNVVSTAADVESDRLGVTSLDQRDRDCLNMMFTMPDKELVRLLEKWKR